jgi:hypothetical protein
LAGLSQWDGVHLQHPPLQLGECLLHPANRIDADDSGGDNAMLVWRTAPRHRARELGRGGRVGNEKPILKNPPKKTPKKHLKKPTKNFLCGFFNFLKIFMKIPFFLFETDFLCSNKK